MPTATFKKLLVLDDDADVRQACLDVLTSAGYSIEIAQNRANAIDRLTESVYDAVIADINMPPPAGIGLLRMARRELPFLTDRFLFLDDRLVLRQEFIQALEGTLSKVLRKPFTTPALLENIKLLTATPLEDHLCEIRMNKRREKRRRWEGPCYISNYCQHATDPIAVNVVELSSYGMKIQYENGPRLSRGAIVTVNIVAADVRREAEVRWSMEFPCQMSAGLMFASPLRNIAL